MLCSAVQQPGDVATTQPSLLDKRQLSPFQFWFGQGAPRERGQVVIFCHPRHGVLTPAQPSSTWTLAALLSMFTSQKPSPASGRQQEGK